MRMRTILPLIGLLALAACKDEKKAENTSTGNPAATGTVAPTTPAPSGPATPATNPPAAPANKPPAQ